MEAWKEGRKEGRKEKGKKWRKEGREVRKKGRCGWEVIDKEEKRKRLGFWLGLGLWLGLGHDDLTLTHHDINFMPRL
jgi:hypothetical protein